MPLLKLVVVADRQRTRADERHLSPEHVQDLRQLVERVAAQHAPDGRHARVVLDLEQRARGFVDGLESGLALGRVCVHRPELHHPEATFAETDAPVAVEDRPG